MVGGWNLFSVFFFRGEKEPSIIESPVRFSRKDATLHSERERWCVWPGALQGDHLLVDLLNAIQALPHPWGRQGGSVVLLNPYPLIVPPVFGELWNQGTSNAKHIVPGEVG